jgi:hypothetical protein
MVILPIDARRIAAQDVVGQLPPNHVRPVPGDILIRDTWSANSANSYWSTPAVLEDLHVSPLRPALRLKLPFEHNESRLKVVLTREALCPRCSIRRFNDQKAFARLVVDPSF